MNFPDLPHLRQLQKDLWQWPKSRASVMVGAGLSLNAQPLPGVTSRFPTWRQLVWAMFEELYPSHPGATQEEVKGREERFISANVLRLASEYEASFGRPKLEQLIRHENPDSEHEPGPLHNLLLQLPWADVFTTNYDTLLERTDIPGRTYQPVTKASELTTAFAPRIVKFHGSFPSQTPFIISEEDYRRYPTDFAPFVNSVQQSLLENSFVLIGFSGEDPNFLAWTGWIRDELGGRHAPIYLVGPLELTQAGRALLDRRGVTPIDLSPLFAGVHCSKGLHATSLDWFLRSLAAARPARPEKWPELDRGSETAPASGPPLLLDSEAAPFSVDLFPTATGPLTLDVAAKVFTRWKHERNNYPGWLVADESKRSVIWDSTKYWIDPLFAFANDLPLADRILLFHEINWRLEIAMVPLFTHWIKSFEVAIEELFEKAADGVPPAPSMEVNSNSGSGEVLNAWLSIALALLREAREMYNAERWNALKANIDRLLIRRPQFTDRVIYESALWAMWNIDRQAAKAILGAWQPATRSPLAMIWKAGLLAELDETGEAKSILRTALSEIRKGLRSNGRNIELLSLEGWCTYLIYSVETAFGLSRHHALRNEFWERWQDLKAWDCSPWPRSEYFQEALSAPPPKPIKPEQKTYGFDPGQAVVSYHSGGNTIDPYLPAFACIRFYEQVGIPMHLAHVNFMGDALMNACGWIAPFISFWSPALLIRAGKLQAVTKDHFLSRARVAQMDSKLASQLYDWCIRILERELKSFTGTIVPSSAQESLFEVVPEVLSRLAFKADIAQLKKAFQLALQIHGLPAIRNHIRLHEVSEPWFRRLFQAADGALLMEWLPLLIKTPIYDESVLRVFPASSVWPDPMRRFPTERVREAKDTCPSLVAEVAKATDWLLSRARSEDSEGWRRATARLTCLYHAQLMTPQQQERLGELLWSRTAASGLPDLPHYASFSFLHLPTPPSVNVGQVVKSYILGMPAPNFATRDATGKISGLQSGPTLRVVYEAAPASKPVILLRGEPHGTLEWTLDEAKQLYARIYAWWANDKDALHLQSMGLKPISQTLELMGDFLSRAVIPALQANDPNWEELLRWLADMRELSIYPSVALPYVLDKRPEQVTNIATALTYDFRGEVSEAITAASEAIRHWINLAAIQRAPKPPPEVLEALIYRVVFRRRLGIESCLINLAYLLTEQPHAISLGQCELLLSSLAPWHDATVLPASQENVDEFPESQRLDLRVHLGGLAGALNFCLNCVLPEKTEPHGLALWRRSCASDPLPEVRRAFSKYAAFQRTLRSVSQ